MTRREEEIILRIAEAGRINITTLTKGKSATGVKQILDHLINTRTIKMQRRGKQEKLYSLSEKGKQLANTLAKNHFTEAAATMARVKLMVSGKSSIQGNFEIIQRDDRKGIKDVWRLDKTGERVENINTPPQPKPDAKPDLLPTNMAKLTRKRHVSD